MNLIKTLITVTLALASAFAFAAVEVNNASQAQLETIKGVGPAMSGKIVEARKNGAFKDWPDLVGRVKGIGAGNAGKFSGDGLTVNGVAYTRTIAAVPRGAGKREAKKPIAETPKK